MSKHDAFDWAVKFILPLALALIPTWLSLQARSDSHRAMGATQDVANSVVALSSDSQDFASFRDSVRVTLRRQAQEIRLLRQAVGRGQRDSIAPPRGVVPATGQGQPAPGVIQRVGSASAAMVSGVMRFIGFGR